MIILLSCLFVASTAIAELKSPFKDKNIDFFPVPVVETRPDQGESYGLMPVVLFSEKESESISLILAAIGRYNSIIKWSGAGIAHWFPRPQSHPHEVLELYFEYAQKYSREISVKYFNPNFLDHFYLDTKFMWLKTPFNRFYGYGADTQESDASNFVSREFSWYATFGYYITKKLRINWTESFYTLDLLTRAFDDVSDTLSAYGGLEGVHDATNLIHKISCTYDTRPNRINSKRGSMLEASYFFSLKDLGFDNSFHGYSLEAVQLLPWFEEKTVTALRFFIQDMYGNGIPFYLQSGLGGPDELRAFIPNRFRDTGKVIFAWEQRIKLIGTKILGIPVAFWADPFFEVGRVFHHIDQLNEHNWQPVGGLGLRAIVPPNVVGRLDIAIGSEDYGIYTVLGYAF